MNIFLDKEIVPMAFPFHDKRIEKRRNIRMLEMFQNLRFALEKFKRFPFVSVLNGELF